MKSLRISKHKLIKLRIGWFKIHQLNIANKLKKSRLHYRECGGKLEHLQTWLPQRSPAIKVTSPNVEFYSTKD